MHFDPKARDKLENASAVAFLPFEVHMGVLSACRLALGPAGYRKFCADQVRESLSNPLLFAKATRAAMHFLGAGPLALLRAVPASTKFIFRDAGFQRLLVAPDEMSATMVYEGFPPKFSNDDVWELIWLGTLDAVTQYSTTHTGLISSVCAVSRDPKNGRFEWGIVLARSSQ